MCPLRVWPDSITMVYTLLHWNVWFRQDIRTVADYIAQLDVDIVCLCELTRNHDAQAVVDGPAYLCEKLGMDYACVDLPLEPPPTPNAMTGPQLANAIFSRHPILGSHSVMINEPAGTGGYADEFRGYVRAEISLPDGRVHVGTTHMSYTHRFQETARKRLETDRLARELARLSQRFLFTGDLNAEPGSYTLDTISDGLRYAGPALPTWATKPFDYDGFSTSSLAWALDHVLATPDIIVHSCEPLITGLSDHLPVLTRFSI